MAAPAHLIAVLALVAGCGKKQDDGGGSSSSSPPPAACDPKQPQTCLDRALDLLGRGGRTPDPQAARELLSATCKASFEPACLALDNLEGYRTEYAEASCLASKAAATCRDVGHRYENSIGTREDRAKARTYYGMACDGGDKDACEERDALPP